MITDVNLPEAAICDVAVARLRSNGWRMVCEVPWRGRYIDAGGTKDGDLILMEAKTCFTFGLRHQLNSLPFYAHFALGVVGSKPRGDAAVWCAKWGIGLWMVRGIEITELVPMQRQSPTALRPVLSLVDRIQHIGEGVCGGRPNLKGVGPAQDVQAEIHAYRAEHPNATWNELYEKIPNHYVSAHSMASAMRNNAERLELRDRIRKLKAEGKWHPHGY